MSRFHDRSWFHTAMLMSALAAGGLTTLLVPPYRELAAVPNDEQEAVSAAASPGAVEGLSNQVRGPQRVSALVPYSLCKSKTASWDPSRTVNVNSLFTL